MDPITLRMTIDDAYVKKAGKAELGIVTRLLSDEIKKATIDGRGDDLVKLMRAQEDVREAQRRKAKRRTKAIAE